MSEQNTQYRNEGDSTRTQQAKHCTGVIEALQRGDSKAVQAAIANGVDSNGWDENGVSVLSWA